MYAEDQTIFTQSKVLFAMSLMEQPKEEMSAVMKELANGKTGFYKDCADTLDSMDKDEFRFLMQEFMDSYAVHAMEYRIPHISRAEVPLDSRLNENRGVSKYKSSVRHFRYRPIQQE